jgi:hypothetical protein
VIQSTFNFFLKKKEEEEISEKRFSCLQKKDFKMKSKVTGSNSASSSSIFVDKISIASK